MGERKDGIVSTLDGGRSTIISEYQLVETLRVWNANGECDGKRLDSEYTQR